MQVDVSSFVLFLVLLGFRNSDAIQCYSCKASGTNEVDANIRCLEQAYLEDCDDFYQYYNDVEDQKPEDLDYYIYDDEYYEEDEDSYGYDEAVNQPRGRRRRQVEETTTKEGDEYDYEKAKYEYDYNNMEEYEYPEDLKELLTHPPTPSPSPSEDKPLNTTLDTKKQQVDDESLPKDPEHYCYSQTHKNKWESYTVEKGCKKIVYCKERYANSPEWGLPWHFCCDRSRCNAKQVEDKPQRIFGMRCRRTDDCIQGHASRSVCPNLFKSCPSISQSLIKMECRAKTKPSKLAIARNPNVYFGQFQEKKCFCLPGLYPKGPICTSSATTLGLSSIILVFFGVLVNAYYY